MDDNSGLTRAPQAVAAMALALLVSACATAPHQMLYVAPDLLPQKTARAAAAASTAVRTQDLVIGPVTGVGSSGMRIIGGSIGVSGTAQIWSQTFHEALFRSVRDAELFAVVRREGDARYLLRADIVEQSVVRYTGSIEVRYALNDRQSNRDVWTDQIATSYTFPVTIASSPLPYNYNTQFRALMRAGAANIEALLDKLSALPAAPN